MATPPLTDEVLDFALTAFRTYGGAAPAALATGINRATLQNRIFEARRRYQMRHGVPLEVLGIATLANPIQDFGSAAAQPLEPQEASGAPEKPREFSVTRPKDVAPEINTDDLIERRMRAFERKDAANEAQKLVEVAVHVTGPFGILFFGDPHLDDDGTDWPALRRDVALCKSTPGLFGANVGDTTNNWIGRLARLYANQSTTAREAWALASWFVGEIPWLFMIAGNHDLWSGDNDPLEWIADREGTVYQASQVRLRLSTPTGQQFTINARHDFTGNSQWNSAHGVMKSLLLGLRDDVAVCGHKHTSGWGVVKDPHSGRVCHALQVASYKRIDPYARDGNMRDNSISPCALVVFDPGAEVGSPTRVTPFWSAEAGARYLTMVRARATAQEAAR